MLLLWQSYPIATVIPDLPISLSRGRERVGVRVRRPRSIGRNGVSLLASANPSALTPPLSRVGRERGGKGTGTKVRNRG